MEMRWFRHNSLLFAAVVLLFTACRHKKDLVKDHGKHSQEKTSDSNHLKGVLDVSSKEIKDNKVYRFVNEWYGVPYKYGGCQKSGVDCSCFANNLYAYAYDKKLPRTSGEIYKECDKVSREKLRQGDLLFFKTNGKSISHVGVYLKDNKFAHASTSKGVIVSDLNEAYYKKCFYSAGRLKHSS